MPLLRRHIREERSINESNQHNQYGPSLESSLAPALILAPTPPPQTPRHAQKQQHFSLLLLCVCLREIQDRAVSGRCPWQRWKMSRYLPWLGQDWRKWPAGRAQSCHEPQRHTFICLTVGEENPKWDLFNISIVSPRKNRDNSSSGVEVTSQTELRLNTRKVRDFLKG